MEVLHSSRIQYISPCVPVLQYSVTHVEKVCFCVLDTHLVYQCVLASTWWHHWSGIARLGNTSQIAASRGNSIFHCVPNRAWAAASIPGEDECVCVSGVDPRWAQAEDTSLLLPVSVGSCIPDGACVSWRKHESLHHSFSTGASLAESSRLLEASAWDVTFTSTRSKKRWSTCVDGGGFLPSCTYSLMIKTKKKCCIVCRDLAIRKRFISSVLWFWPSGALLHVTCFAFVVLINLQRQLLIAVAVRLAHKL